MIFVPPGCGTQLEHLFWPGQLDIFRRKEAREVVTDNFIGFVSFDTFGAGVPTDDPSLWVQREDRVVLDFIEKDPIFFFALPERVLGRVGGFGNVRKGLTGFEF